MRAKAAEATEAVIDRANEAQQTAKATTRKARSTAKRTTRSVTRGTTNTEVSLQTGLLFGNAIRDGTGLLNVSDYPNSQDFNAISEALNRLVETRVQPKLREAAKVGAMIRFVGCAEVGDESTDLKPLKVVPVLAER